MARIIISNHARKRMVERDMSDEEVAFTVKWGRVVKTAVDPVTGNVKNTYQMVFSPGWQVRVVVDTVRQQVVTVFYRGR